MPCKFMSGYSHPRTTNRPYGAYFYLMQSFSRVACAPPTHSTASREGGNHEGDPHPVKRRAF